MTSRWLGAVVLLLSVVACGDDRTSARAPSDVSVDESAIQATKASLAPILARSTDGLVEQTLPNGGVKVNLEGRFQSAMVAKIGPDGQIVTDCVDTVEDAESFLRAEAAAVGTGSAGSAK